ncbi:hypothetical protein DF3PB_4430001 [uncultured Defluviicoccus sp.]|uniref:Uncharacterized protein n=1 Tax=metagenome TaxID=256318 RepID=A0A380TIE9_9ZZZZ|nr:hypothetical protein DF3PB_4430001 [uncultured Defluviicoccus sp.]
MVSRPAAPTAKQARWRVNTGHRQERHGQPCRSSFPGRVVALTELVGGLYPALLTRPAAAALAGFIAVTFAILGGGRCSNDAEIGRAF